MEISEYDLNVVELAEYYNKTQRLFILKNELLDNYMMNNDYSKTDVEFLEYLLTRKILELQK